MDFSNTLMEDLVMYQPWRRLLSLT